MLGGQVELLEHVGSTSVPGLAAKPIVDILLAVTDPAAQGRWVPPDTDINLHVRAGDSPETARNLRFRDHLRADRADRELYERTKRELAARTWTYIQQYADAKSGVVEDILRRCGP